MPTGLYIRRRREDNFRKTYPTPISAIATEWLACMEEDLNIPIKHARNGPEFRVGPQKIPVDGYSEYVYHKI